MLLRELVARGVRVDSTYNYCSPNKLVDIGARKQFSWTCGALELPVSAVFDFRGLGRHVAYNFNDQQLAPPKTLDAVVRHFKYLDQFYRDFGEDAIAVMVMHSWSLLRLGSSGHFEYDGQGALERFDALLEALRGAVEFVTARDVSARLSDSHLEPGEMLELPDGQPRRPHPERGSAPSAVGGASVRAAASAMGRARDACPICSTPFSQFADFNGRRRRCTG